MVTTVEITTVEALGVMEPANEPKTQTIDATARELGIGRNQAYAAAKRGEIPTIRIGKRILVLKDPLKRMLEGESNRER
jgi:hypothetical protein